MSDLANEVSCTWTSQERAASHPTNSTDGHEGKSGLCSETVAPYAVLGVLISAKLLPLQIS